MQLEHKTIKSEYPPLGQTGIASKKAQTNDNLHEEK